MLSIDICWLAYTAVGIVYSVGRNGLMSLVRKPRGSPTLEVSGLSSLRFHEFRALETSAVHACVLRISELVVRGSGSRWHSSDILVILHSLAKNCVFVWSMGEVQWLCSVVLMYASNAHIASTASQVTACLSGRYG